MISLSMVSATMLVSDGCRRTRWTMALAAALREARNSKTEEQNEHC